MTEPSGPAGPIVLLVEDDQDTREMYVLGLQMWGIAAEPAESAAEAFALLGRVRPAVVVTDLTLPGVDGLELCQELAADPRTRDIPRIVLTGRSTDPVADSALLSACTRVLHKPLPPDELAAVISQVLESN